MVVPNKYNSDKGSIYTVISSFEIKLAVCFLHIITFSLSVIKFKLKLNPLHPPLVAEKRNLLLFDLLDISNNYFQAV